MNQYFEEFSHILDTENKDLAVEFILNLLKDGQLSLESLYLDLLAPALSTYACPVADKDICIWKEHTRTSIVRTILECSYPYVIERRKKIKSNHKKVMVLTPSEEYHEIGAIIVNHYFLLAGFDSQYIGANTPKPDILKAVRALSPDYIAISVTNYYNIVITKQITEEIKTNYPNVKIIIGGLAFLQNGALEQVKHDHYMAEVKDAFKISKEA